MKVGIPRALYFYRFFPQWEGMLTSLDCELTVSPETNKHILEKGAEMASNELCVPVKIYYGHINYLNKEHPELDYIFTPRYVSLDNNHYYCPKFMILPNTTEYAAGSEIPVLEWLVNVRRQTLLESTIMLGKELGKSRQESKKALIKGVKKQKEFEKLVHNGLMVPEALDEMYPDYDFMKRRKSKYEKMDNSDRPVNLLVLGHPYNTYETIINQDLLERLKSSYVNIMTLENAPKKVYDKEVMIDEKLPNYWGNEEEILQLSDYVLGDKEEIDGAIFLISFACGPDSLIQEIVMRNFSKEDKPFLELVLDEHSGEAGLVTRVETFVDTIRRKKYMKVKKR